MDLYSESVADSPSINLSSTLGGLFFGCVFSTWLYGVVCSQCYFFMKYRLRGGKFELKFIVSFLWILETLHLCLFTHGYYDYVVNSHHNPARLSTPEATFYGMVPCTLAVAALVHYVWLKRIWALSKSKLRLIFAVVMVSVTLFGWGVGFLWTALSLTQNTWTQVTPWLVYTPLACLTVNDLIATSFLCATLQRSKLGIRSTDDAINVFIVFALNTGLLTSVCSVITVVLLLFSSLQQWYVSMYVVLNRLYVNSLLAMLNYGASPRSHLERRWQRAPRVTPTGSNYSVLELTTIPLDMSIGTHIRNELPSTPTSTSQSNGQLWD